ncbi:MAG: response regulator transcription factor [Phycisphaerae bacterium]|nr:response regulator transcription factor [Phycisphaerae bacterium]
MKATASIATRLIESVCQLPGVAVLDWCDRAAASLTITHTPSAAFVTVAQVDPRGMVKYIESTGAAWCGRTEDEQPVPPGQPPSPISLQRTRDSLHVSEPLGWEPKVVVPGEASLNVTKIVPAISRRAATGLNRRWDELSNCTLVLGAVQLSPSLPDRLLLCELAMCHCPPEDLARHQVVLQIALPMIAARFLNAIGPSPADKHSWLTPREEAILWKLVSGKKVPVIAEELHRSIYTIHDHVKSLHRKLGASNRGQLVSRALGHLGPLVAKAAAQGAKGDDHEDDDRPRGGPSARTARAQPE